MFSRTFSSHSNRNNSDNNLNLNAGELLDAIDSNDLEKMKNVLEDPNLKIWEIKDENGYTTLHRSAFKNNYEISSFIIDEVKKGLGMGSNKVKNYINEKTNEGFTALHYAVNNGNIKIVNLLKDNGAKIEMTTNAGKNVIHLAAEGNQPSMILYLMLNEALDINSVDENGSTPLHWACYSGSYEAVNYLISLNVNINALDKEKFTPLHLAVSNNRETIVRLLLQKGVNKNILNCKNESPVDIARAKNYLNIVKLLSTKDYNPLCSLELPIEYIAPSDIYKKVIFCMIIIPEIIIFFLVLPFLEELYHTYANIVTFILCLLTYIILIKKDPGYQKNKILLNDCKRENINNPLKKLVDDEKNLKDYCPVCFVENGYERNIKHCFICNKCVLKFNHHCFWINKCIGKENKIVYLIFIFFSFVYTFHLIFISIYLLFDSVNIPYEKPFPLDWFNFAIDRGFRVLGAGIVLVFSFIISFPLFFLFMIDIFKSCGLLGKKKRLNNEDDSFKLIENDDVEPLISKSNNENKNEINNINIYNDNIINTKENNNSDNNDEINDNDEKRNEEEEKIKIPQNNFPLVDNRPSNEK